MAKTKINIAYVATSKVATEHKLHTLPATLRGMVDVATSKTTSNAEKESTKKVLFGLLGVSDESEVANVVNLANEVKAMRKACFEYYPYMQIVSDTSKKFLTRKGCYYSRQGSSDTPQKGFYFVENIDYNNIIHTAEKSRAKGTAQKEVYLYTLYKSNLIPVDENERYEDTDTDEEIGYTLYSKCEDDKTGKTYYKKCKQQPFEVVTTPAETMKLEESITQEKDTKEKDTKVKTRSGRTRRTK